MEFISIRDLHRRWKEGLEVPPAKLPFLNFPDEASPLVEGWSHVIAGKPKIGKTELILQVIMGWVNKRVLWFTEEPRSAWVLRVAMMDKFFDTVPGNFMLVTGCQRHQHLAFSRLRLGQLIPHLRRCHPPRHILHPLHHFQNSLFHLL